MKIKQALLLALFIALGIVPSAFAQKKGTKKDSNKSDTEKSATVVSADSLGRNAKVGADNFNAALMEKLILLKINDHRADKKMDSLRSTDILVKAAKDQAMFMAKEEEVSVKQGGKKKTTADRVKYYGGGASGEELVLAQPANKGKDDFTYEEIADLIVQKWAKGKQGATSLNNSNKVYVGVGVAFESASKKVYVSAVFGDFETFNIGASKRKELPVPFTTKKYKLKKVEKAEDDKKYCKKCQKFGEVEFRKLYDGLYIEDGKVYLRYDNLKYLQSKLLKDKRDGFAVDFVERDQYPCLPYNIYDNKRVNKGVMIKRKWSKTLLKDNIVANNKAAKGGVEGKKSKGKSKASAKGKKKAGLNVLLGEVPPNLPADYEINLLVIQKKRVCRVLSRKYVENGGIQSRTPLDVIPDTLSRTALKYKPEAEVKQLSFRIPFEKSKFNYSPKDIEPILTQLKEPDYIINNISIVAYSSIEGDSLKNAELEKKRAQAIQAAIVKMRQKNQNVQIQEMDIKNSDGWEQFKSQIKGTKYAPLGMMAKADAKKAITGTALEKDMEKLLSEQRYADVKMTITYDIVGEEEEPYVINTYNKAIEKGNGEKALEIQQFMIAQALEGKYDPENILSLNVPQKGEFASLFVNKLWLQKYLSNDTLSSELADAFFTIAPVAPGNDFVKYNSMYSNLEFNALPAEQVKIDSLQTVIESINNPRIPQDYVANLNIEQQFRIIDEFDDKPQFKGLVEQAVGRLKSLYKIDASNSWQNALKLAYIFSERGDYDY